jgi:hypothetical protein
MVTPDNEIDKLQILDAIALLSVQLAQQKELIEKIALSLGIRLDGKM